jgi:hypothetical protein
MNSFKRAIQEQYGNILSKEQFTTAGLNAETLMYAFLIKYFHIVLGWLF